MNEVIDDDERDRLVDHCMDLGSRPTLEAVHHRVAEHGHARLSPPDLTVIAVEVTLRHTGSVWRELADVVDQRFDGIEEARQRVENHFGDAGRWINKLMQDSNNWIDEQTR